MCVLPMNTTQCPGQGSNPDPDPESSALTIRPPRLMAGVLNVIPNKYELKRTEVYVTLDIAIGMTSLNQNRSSFLPIIKL